MMEKLCPKISNRAQKKITTFIKYDKSNIIQYPKIDSIKKGSAKVTIWIHPKANIPYFKSPCTFTTTFRVRLAIIFRKSQKFITLFSSLNFEISEFYYVEVVTRFSYLPTIANSPYLMTTQ